MDASYGSAKSICTDTETATRGNDMVEVRPYYPLGYPEYPYDQSNDQYHYWYPAYPQPIEKKWKERHIKDVKKGIFITFDDDSDPVFIATDDACFDKIMKAIKE